MKVIVGKRIFHATNLASETRRSSSSQNNISAKETRRQVVIFTTGRFGENENIRLQGETPGAIGRSGYNSCECNVEIWIREDILSALAHDLMMAHTPCRKENAEKRLASDGAAQGSDAKSPAVSTGGKRPRERKVATFSKRKLDKSDSDGGL